MRSWWVTAVWVVAFALLILNAAVSAYSIDVLIDNDRAVTRSRDLTDELDALLSEVKDAETGQRGFQITGREDFLEPFISAEQALGPRLDRLRKLAAGETFHEARVEPLAKLVQVRLAELRENIRVRRAGGPDAAADLIRRGQGKVTMDQIRYLVEEMRQHEGEVLAQRSRVSRERFRAATFTAIVGGVVTVLMVAMAYATVRGELARRRRAELDARRAADDLSRSQRDIADTLALLDTFLANAPIGMAFLDPDLRYVRINNHLAAANARSVEEHLGRRVTELAPGEMPDILSDLRCVLETGQSAPNRLVTGRPGGGDRVWQSSYFPVRTKDDRVLGVGVVSQDVTDRLAAERELKESVDRFRSLAETVPQIVWVTDASGRLTLVNRRWVDYTGLPADAAGAGGWSEAIHPDDREGLTSAWQAALSNPGERFTYEYRLRSAGGEYRWMLSAAVPVRSGNRAVRQWVGTLTDIEDQKRQSETLATLVRMRTAELESANQLLREEIGERTRAEGRAEAAAVELRRSNEELEKFAYVASHDLQEPLRKIQAFGDRLVTKYREGLTVEAQEYVDRMKASATRMRTLIDDLLTFSRVTSKAQPFSPVDLTAIVEEVVSELEVRVHQTGGRVDAGPLPTLSADPMQMRQLFQNLIGNALKFHKPDAPPVVTIRGMAWQSVPPDAEPPPPSGRGFRVTVADNGIGFDQVYAERVFEVFQRLHGRFDYEGTGIGLAICRKIVQRHGGSIAASGREGEGAVFIIDLPADGALQVG